jgi:hypothetical protein
VDPEFKAFRHRVQRFFKRLGFDPKQCAVVVVASKLPIQRVQLRFPGGFADGRREQVLRAMEDASNAAAFVAGLQREGIYREHIERN